ncbi:MAG: hypothetical protein HY293_02505, partial [Planctomycetes bacterium]|nr:hypothetical protein [Planctomycetota bacterium]
MNAPGAAVLALLLALASPDGELDAALAKLKAVAPEGKGNDEAAKAWKAVVARGPEALLPALAAFEGADARAANWLRSAVDAIVENASAKKQPLDLARLRLFINDIEGPAAGRVHGYEWLARLDAAAADELLGGFLNDPARELRRAGVANTIARYEKMFKPGNKSAVENYQRLLKCARDRDQVDLIVKQLKAFGVEADVQALYGVVAKWVLISSFDNTGMKGFDAAYAPEKAVDLKAKWAGKGDAAVR